MKKRIKKRLVWGLHPMAMLADMAAWKQVFRIHDDNPDRTACRPISIKSQSSIEKNRTVCLIKSHPDWDLKNIALRAGLKRMKRIISFLLREPATVFYWVIFLFWHKTDLHGWRADGRARSHNLNSVHGNIGKKITFFNLIILNNQTQGSMWKRE